MDDARTTAVSSRGSLVADLTVSSMVAGLLAVVVSYSGPMVIILAAAQAGHLTAGQTASWVWAVSIGSGVTGIALSLWTRTPVITAWSSAGAALLVGSLPGVSFSHAVGAYLVCALAMTAVGLSGLFGRLMQRVPLAVVSAMLAGILFEFGIGAFTALGSSPLVPGVVLGTYVAAKRFSPRYAVLLALVAGVAVAAAEGTIDVSGVRFDLARPEWTTPALDVASVIGIGVPLFVVTMASQNATGLGVMRAAGYRPDDRLLIGVTGATSALLAPFGCHAVNLAAITAAICTGPEAHADPRKRYPAGVFCGLFYLIVGSFGVALLTLFTGLPQGLVAAIAGVALLGALMGGLKDAMTDERDREAALVTFLATASGMTFFGVGAAFWGLVLGMAVHLVLSVGRGSRASLVD